MTLTNSIQAGLSGMEAASAMLNVAASNIANLNSPG
jgi:flagellar hook-associated protein FlgK